MHIRVNLKIFLFIAIFYFTKQIEIYGVLMLFAFLHEIGHLLCGIFLGLKPKELKIMPLGLCVSFQVTPDEYNEKIQKGNKIVLKKLAIAIAGPITNFALAILYILFPIFSFGMGREIMVYSNLVIGIFNLIPIYPLDGGRILHHLFHLKLGLKKANEKIYHITNQTVAILTAITSIAIYYFKNIALLFILAYLWYLVIQENRMYHIKKHMYEMIQKEKQESKELESIS
ncbi:MAG: site-2 protease family protein [Clostridia bacterium]